MDNDHVIQQLDAQHTSVLLTIVFHVSLQYSTSCAYLFCTLDLLFPPLISYNVMVWMPSLDKVEKMPKRFAMEDKKRSSPEFSVLCRGADPCSCAEERSAI